MSSFKFIIMKDGTENRSIGVVSIENGGSGYCRDERFDRCEDSDSGQYVGEIISSIFNKLMDCTPGAIVGFREGTDSLLLGKRWKELGTKDYDSKKWGFMTVSDVFDGLVKSGAIEKVGGNCSFRVKEAMSDELYQKAIDASFREGGDRERRLVVGTSGEKFSTADEAKEFLSKVVPFDFSDYFGNNGVVLHRQSVVNDVLKCVCDFIDRLVEGADKEELKRSLIKEVKNALSFEEDIISPRQQSLSYSIYFRYLNEMVIGEVS